MGNLAPSLTRLSAFLIPLTSPQELQKIQNHTFKWTIICPFMGVKGFGKLYRFFLLFSTQSAVSCSRRSIHLCYLLTIHTVSKMMH